MKLVFSLFILIAESLAFAHSPPSKPLEVFDVNVVAVSPGCGAAPVKGPAPTCPGSTRVYFKVPFGGACHVYTASFSTSNGTNYMMINDYELLSNCAAPDVQNYATSIEISDSGPKDSTPTDGALHLSNPLYVRVVHRP